MVKTTHKRTGRAAFGNPTSRSSATLHRMGAAKRAARTNRWTAKLVRFATAMTARTL